MKKIKFTFLFYFTILILSVIIQSCYKCDYKITEIDVLHAEGTPSNVIRDSITIIRGEFSLVSLAKTEVAALPSSSGMLQTANAFGCGGNIIINPIEKSSVRISCDKSFKFDNVEISTDSSFHQLVNIIIYDYDLGGLEIHFDSTFINQAEFQKDLYTFKVQSRTTDCLVFSNELILEMDL